MLAIIGQLEVLDAEVFQSMNECVDRTIPLPFYGLAFPVYFNRCQAGDFTFRLFDLGCLIAYESERGVLFKNSALKVS